MRLTSMLICPNCKKKYRSNVLVCPKCALELLPPSAVKLRTRHPDSVALKPAPKSKPSPLPSAEKPDEPHIDLLRGSLQEMNEAVRFLKAEGILCRIDRDDTFPFQYRLGGETQTADPGDRVVRVPASQIEKARALLDWESQREDLNEPKTPLHSGDEEETMLCPACETEITSNDETCPECGRELDMEGEADEEEFFCSSCGEACDPDDPVCPNCGAHFDH